MVVTLGLGFASPAASAPRDALWWVIELCKTDARLVGRPWPCLHVDRQGGFAILADPNRPTQILLTPTRRIFGIEDPSLRSSAAPNLWSGAWRNRALFRRRTGRPGSALDPGFAVNSRFGRTQDQLHIHIDCVRWSVRMALDAEVDTIGDDWTDLKQPLGPHRRRYRARWLDEGALASNDPFRLLDEDAAPDHADRLTLAMIPAVRASGSAGFLLLSHEADPRAHDPGAAEELLDHRCGSR